MRAVWKYIMIHTIIALGAIFAASGQELPAMADDFGPRADALASDDSQPSLLGAASEPALPSYIMIIDDDANIDEVHISDSLFNAVAGQTIFKVNKMEINTRDPWLKELTDYTLPLINSQQLMLMGIDLRGAASPEGPYRWNETLSHGRANALKKYLIQHIDSISSLEMLTNTTAEDYPHLLWLMEQRDDPDTEVVREIMSRCGIENHADIKASLKKYKKGKLWKRLLKQYYPELRSARVVLIFKKIKPDEPEKVTPQPPYQRPTPIHVETTPIVDMPEFTLDMPEIHIPYAIERPHVLSISSNLLYDAFYMPNFGWAPMPNLALEYYPLKGNYTVRAEFMWPYYHKWDKQKFFQIRDYHLEVRRYFSPGKLHTGAYLGAYVNATKYGIGLGKKKGWQGEGIGGALKAGYVLPLGNGRWRLDFHIAAGAWMTRFDPYVYGNPINGDEDGDYYYDWTQGPDTFHKRNHRLWWIGPSEIGVTLTFDLLYKRIFAPGVSFNRKEVLW